LNITNKIVKSDLIEWRSLEWLQGKFKTIPDNSLKKLKQSLINNSFVQPFNVWENGKLWILDGHHRKLAMEQLEAEGYDIPDKLPANFIQCKDKKEASKMVLLYSSIYAKADEQSLTDFLNESGIDFADVSAEIDLPELDLENFTTNEIDEEKLDEVPEPQKDAISKTGDIFLIDGKHRVMCGDSTVRSDVEALMEGKRADMVFTDPPYGINEKGDRSKRGGLAKGNHLPDFKDDSIDYAVKAFNIVSELDIKRQVWWGANYYCHSLPLSNNWFVWDKRVEEKQKDTQSDCELAWVKSKWSSIRIFRHLWKGLMKDSEKGEKRVHATQKPVALAVWAFEYFKDFTTVLDLFLGSGSTLIASQQTNRICYGMELDPIYIDVILRRYKNLYPDAKFECLNREVDFETLFSKN